VPLYEYECGKCGHRFEKIQKFSDPPPKSCPECGGKVKKLPSAPAIQFKGTGWYITDYARKTSHGPEGKESKASESEEKGGKSSESQEKSAQAKEKFASEKEKSSREKKSAPAPKKKDSGD
jgi:putative FmdB family regulatory protein